MQYVIAAALFFLIYAGAWFVFSRFKRLKRRYQTLLENAGDAVVVINDKGKLIHASSSIFKVLGYTPEQVLKLDISAIAHPDDSASLSDVMAQVMANPGVPIKGHTGRMRHGDGSWRWYEAVVTNMLHDRDIRGIVDNFRDVTETVLAQEKTRSANRLYGFISQINQAIVQTNNEDELFSETCRIATDIGNFKMAWVGLLNKHRTKVSLAQGSGIPESFMEWFDGAGIWPHGPISQVLASGGPYVCNDINNFRHYGWRNFATANGILSFMVLPIRKNDEIIGTLNLYSGQRELFSAQECGLLEEVAGDISFAINAFQRERSRKRAEKQRQTSELRLKQAQSIAHVGSFEIDFSTGISTWSEELCRIYGFDTSDNSHPYDAWLEMVHPEDIQHVHKVIAEVKDSLAPSAIYHRIIRRDGSVRHIFSQGEYELDELGRAIGMHGVAHDITQIKESEGARSRYEQNLQLIMDLIPQGIFIKDKHGHYLFVNKSFASLYGVSAEEFLLEDIFKQLEVEGERNLFLEQDQQVIRTGVGITIPEQPYTLADGSIKYFYTVKVPYELPGNQERGMLGISLDITSQKQAELERAKMMADLVRRNKDLEQFSYVVSHNVRAPLVNIISLIALLDPKGVCEDEDVIAALTESTEKLDSVIRDLNFILNMNHELTEALERVDFASLIADIKISIANLIESSGVSITTDFSQAQHTYCYKSYLHSIFYNLILNSIKYRRTDKAAIIHISSRIDSDKLVLEFADNGMGINLEKNAEQLFGLYKRFHPEIEGKGMGLYMVNMQVQQLNGTISVESEVGVGTTFKIVFEMPEKTNS
ncbi:PAS domain S-box protein [Pedobacter polaris]|uniref:histidine kinase n=1 Tax=Pedobacter polaris TaxID=2571273 RepID=A0A4U1CW86_9SPHI|nr:PAS domain S-box protein [Pedobacter polaris]TKC10529.1 PAS domain S-box protein [Pedobacter polaris]